MKKHVRVYAVFCKFMKITLLQFTLAITFMAVAYANDSNGQEVLERKVSVQANQKQIAEVLEKLAKEANVRFIYSYELIHASRTVNVNANEQRLKLVLDDLLDPMGIAYSVSANKSIVLTMKSDFFIVEDKARSYTQTQVTGTITDELGAVIPGANIMVKGTTNGTSSDADGKYVLQVEDPNATLVFSFIGYVSEEVPLNGRTTVDMVLMPDVKTLGEVVVIGYGEQSKRKLTTAISKVNSQDIGIQPISTPGEALAGLAAGVQVQSARGGTPGDAPQIRIRGVGSIGGSNDVLYVVDGYPLQNANNFNQINPADIESMEVLKDAASAAIYGSRAANGVIIVTTKRGKSGKTHFDFNAYSGIQTNVSNYELMNKDEYIAFAKRGSAIRAVSYPTILDNPDNLPDTDWQNQIYRAAKISSYQLTATGGTDKVRFMISGGYFSQEGTLKGTDYDRITLRFNVDTDLSAKLKLGVSMAPSYSQQHRIPATGQFSTSDDGNIGRPLPNVINSSLLMQPVISPFDADGDYGQPNSDPAYSEFGFFAPTLFNPLSTIEQTENRFRNFRNLSNSFLEWSVMKNLKLKSSIGVTFDVEDQYGYIPATTNVGNGASGNITTPNLNNIWAIERNRRDIDWVWENTANYSMSFGKNEEHSISVLGLYSLQRFNSKFVSANGKIGTYNNQTVRNVSASTDVQGSVSYDENAFMSLASRISYDYKGKYLLTAAIRRDGSSKFGPNNRFSNFPSVSAAWRIIDENFMQSTKSILSDLKIRASYGETGNANIGSFTWANSVTSSNYVFGTTRNLGAQQSGLSNSDLTWEKNKQRDIGLEIGFLDNKINVSVDYYVRNTEDMLINKDLLGITGYATSYRANVGSLQNKGIELNINTNFNLGEVRWSSDYNFSSNQNEITSLGGPTSLAPQAAIFGWNNVFKIEVGQPIGNFNGFVVEGVFKSAEDLANYPQWTSGNLVGDWRIKDVDGSGKIDENDRTVLGNAIPRYTYSATQRFAYKGFELSVLLQGVADVSIINGNLRQVGTSTGNFNTLKEFVDNYYDPIAPDRNVKWHRINGNTGVTIGNQLTNYAVFDASYLRVRNITLGYNLPTNWLSTVKIQNARVYISCQNLFTTSKYPGGNPEASIQGNNGDSVFQPGVDQGAYPAVRTITAGLTIGF